MRIIAERLKKERAIQKTTQSQVAQALGVSEAQYRQWELSIRAPAAENLCKLADYFNVTTDYLLGRTNKPN